jgi:hypothetical protein
MVQDGTMPMIFTTVHQLLISFFGIGGGPLQAHVVERAPQHGSSLLVAKDDAQRSSTPTARAIHMHRCRYPVTSLL